MPAQPNPPPPKLPSTADFNQILNSISLASAKHNTILQSLRTRHPTSRAVGSSSSSGNAGFSGLRGTHTHHKVTATADAEDADFHAEPLNAGIGYKAAKGEQESRTATRDLGRRLLGKRGRDGDAKGKAGRRVAEEESDEDEGRSGLGRSKRIKDVEQDDLDDQNVALEEPSVTETSHNQGEVENAAPKTRTRIAAEDDEAVDDEDQTAPAHGIIVPIDSEQPPLGEGKKKRKKKKKNRKKAAATAA